MKRFLALLALVLALMAGTPGMASASPIGFDSPSDYIPFEFPPLSLPYLPDISGTTSMYWDGTGAYGGHLYCANFTQDSIISFTSSTYVNSFQMSGMRMDGEPGPQFITFGPMTIAALNADGATVWSKTVTNLGNYIELCEETGWLTVTVNTAAVSKIIFYGPNPLDIVNYPDTDGWNPDGPAFYPSIDNLVINEAAAVPIPASVWLLGSGLLALVGLRRKFTR